MRKTMICTIAAMGLATIAAADSHMAPAYTAKDLLSPCQEADNDARWGAAAEAECEQYIMGFVDGLKISGADEGICLPEANRPDEIRWAFTRWIHGAYGQRTQMPAADAVLAAIKESFPCSN